MEDPIFAPWSTEDDSAAPPSRRPPPPARPPDGPTGGATAEREPAPGTALARRLRAEAVPALQEIGRRLRVARHGVTLRDGLDEEPSLLRFTLTPRDGPLARVPSERSATLEIGTGASSDEVTAWYWLHGSDEAPDWVSRIPAARLSATWIERVALHFVQRVLGRL